MDIKNAINFVDLSFVLFMVSYFVMKDSFLIFISTFLTVYGILIIFNNISNNIFKNIFILLGKKSTYIWFIHCIFFNQLALYTQPFLYFFKDPLLVLINGIILCLFLVFLIEKFWYYVKIIYKMIVNK